MVRGGPGYIERASERGAELARIAKGARRHCSLMTITMIHVNMQHCVRRLSRKLEPRLYKSTEFKILEVARGAREANFRAC